MNQLTGVEDGRKSFATCTCREKGGRRKREASGKAKGGFLQSARNKNDNTDPNDLFILMFNVDVVRSSSSVLRRVSLARQKNYEKKNRGTSMQTKNMLRQNEDAFFKRMKMHFLKGPIARHPARRGPGGLLP